MKIPYGECAVVEKAKEKERRREARFLSPTVFALIQILKFTNIYDIDRKIVSRVLFL